MESLFVTGATGFIGRLLVSRLAAGPFERIYCLSRTGRNAASGTDARIEVITGSLQEPQTYASALESCRTVVHLAGATGKAAPAECFEVNARGTEALVEECERRGVKKFLHVSTIAVKYPQKGGYPYAQSKALGEEAVKESRLDYLIVRPTIVIGRGGTTWQTLSKLARKKILVMPGDGRTRIQPIAIEDVVGFLSSMASERSFSNETLELGGPEVLSIECFLRRIHFRSHGKEPAVVHLPLKPVITALTVLERLLGSAVPVRAGQLAAFNQDGTVQASPRLERVWPQMMNVDQILGRVMADG